MRQESRVALVTGGGRRLGRAMTEGLAGRGYRLVVHYGRSRQAAESTVRLLAEREVEALAIGADLSRPDEIDRMFETVEARFGRLDVLVNSAASFEKKPLTDIAPADWDAVMAINLRAPFLCMRRAVPLLRRGYASSGVSAAVVNVADLSGVSPWPGYSHHGASKAGLLHLTETAARELAPEIRVNAIIPGAVLPPPGVDDEDPAWQRQVKRLPIGRRGQPADIGAAVAYLAEAQFVVGSTLVVDGGEHLLGAGHRVL